MPLFLKTLSGCLCLLIILLAAGCTGNDSEQKRPPNILLILTDDLGNNDIASWGDGTAPTPNIDALSKQSVRFRQHYTDSTCSPSRAALLTGQQPVSIGFQPAGPGLSSDLATLPKSLQKLGYRTVHIGKWHVGEALEYPEIQPGNQGFDYWFGFLNHFVLRGPNPDGTLYPRSNALSVPTHIDPWLQENGGEPKQYKGYLDDILTAKAIEEMAAQKQPWFINLWLFAPHTPYQPSPRFRADFPDTPEGKFRSILKHIDYNVQSLLDALQQQGLSDNTLVIFASDNGGPNIARDNNFPLTGRKIEYLDGGVRSPLLLHWPDHFESQDIIAPTHITDIYPTLLDYAGGQPPEGIMGRDLRPLLEGRPLNRPEGFFWMAETQPGDMTFGGHLLETTTYFYKSLQDHYQAGVTHAAIGEEPRTAQSAYPSIPASAANQKISQIERTLRSPPFHWQQDAQGGPGRLSGRDFQRAPVFGGYSIGLSLDLPAKVTSTQAILDQPGIWQIDWLADQRLRIRVGEVEQFSAPIKNLKPGCNKLVIATHIKPASSFPFPGPASSIMNVYWNGDAILESKRVLNRPTSATSLKNPTWIGNSADGKHPFAGNLLGKPAIVNKLLLPTQDGYSLEELQSDLCRQTSSKLNYSGS